MFTAGVFQDVEWAARGIAALRHDGFESGSISVLALASAAVRTLIQTQLQSPAVDLAIEGLGDVSAAGSILATFQGSDGALAASGLAAAAGRAGFQLHDGRLFQTLILRGGVFVAVDTDGQAGDALATLHAYGGANAAIGAWLGRLS